MSKLKDLLDANLDGQVIYGDNIEQKYLTDYIGTHIGYADAYVRVRHEQDVIATLKIASLLKVPVVVRGAGTNLTGSTIPEGGIVLDTSDLNHIIKLDEKNLTITVEPGVRLKDLNAYVEERGYFYAPDPAEKNASIGGNVSTNAGGMRAVKYGVTRNYVLAMDLIRIDGTKLSLGAETYKYASGLNLQQLVVGSEGTLGVITKLVLKLLPLPQTTLSALLAFDSLRQALHCVNTILRSTLGPSAVEFIEKKVVAYGERYLKLQFPSQEAKAYLIVSLDGNDHDVKERFYLLESLASKEGALNVLPLTAGEETKRVWAIRSAVATAVNTSGKWEPVDVVVPIDKIDDFITYAENLSAQSVPKLVAFGHAGDGNIHLCVLKEQIEDKHWNVLLEQTLSKLYAHAYSLGGLVSGEHGIGKNKKAFFLRQTQYEQVAIMRGIKAAFDHDNLLNPHNGYAI